MNQFRTTLNQWSIREETKAIKVGIAGFIAVYLSKYFGEAAATTACITVFLALALYPTISESRLHYKHRLLSNIYACGVTIFVTTLLHNSIYSLPIIFFLVILFYYLFRLQSKINLLNSGVAVVIFYVYISSGDHLPARFIAIIIGTIIAFIFVEFILPLNYGLITEQSLEVLSNELFTIHHTFLHNEGILDEVDAEQLTKCLHQFRDNLEILDREVEAAAKHPHLRGYVEKMEKFHRISKVSSCSCRLMKTIMEYNEEFLALSQHEQIYILHITKKMHKIHKHLVYGIFGYQDTPSSNHQLTIDHEQFDLTQKVSVLILSRLIEYDQALKQISLLSEEI